MSTPSFFNALLKGRCPACRQGSVFKTFIGMHKSCSICGTIYEREHGFFLMAIFYGYILNAIVFAPLALYGYFTNRLIPVTIIICIGIVLLFAPTFRYSRMIWLYMDQMLDPRRDSNVKSKTEFSTSQ